MVDPDSVEKATLWRFVSLEEEVSDSLTSRVGARMRIMGVGGDLAWKPVMEGRTAVTIVALANGLALLRSLNS